jgi:trk system potassium uptake protein TrkA
MIPIRDSGDHSPDETEEITHYILGGTNVGIAIAERLHAAGHGVAIVDESHEPGDIPGVSGDPAAAEVLSESGIEAASTVVVATGLDRRNLLVAQLVRARFDVPRVVAFVNDPDRLPLFAEAGHEPFCVTTALSEAVGEAL